MIDPQDPQAYREAVLDWDEVDLPRPRRDPRAVPAADRAARRRARPRRRRPHPRPRRVRRGRALDRGAPRRRSSSPRTSPTRRARFRWRRARSCSPRATPTRTTSPSRSAPESAAVLAPVSCPAAVRLPAARLPVRLSPAGQPGCRSPARWTRCASRTPGRGARGRSSLPLATLVALVVVGARDRSPRPARLVRRAARARPPCSPSGCTARSAGRSSAPATRSPRGTADGASTFGLRATALDRPGLDRRRASAWSSRAAS